MPLQATAGAATYDAFGGGVTAANYIEDVFSTWLYTGNGSSQTITNGIDLSTKGGLVWMKGRSGATDHALYDTARGATKDLVSNSVAAETTQSTGLTAFGSTGFSIGALAKLNTSSATYASWTFRKAPKFFDVVTWTGNGSNRTIAHNLGSVPGCIIVKGISYADSWTVYHRSLANTQYMVMNTTTPATTLATVWNSTTATSSVFSLGTDTKVNQVGETYVAYIFAHDAGGFGASGTDNVISCGSFTTDGSGYSPDVNLGYEPQWVLLKPSGGTGDWLIVDTMRGWVNPAGTAADDANLRPNKSDAEALNDIGWPTATGFNAGYRGTANNQWIYIAIRRDPMRTPTTGTSVFAPSARSGTGAAGSSTALGNVTDLAIIKQRGSTQTWAWTDRLRGATNELTSAATTVETAYSNDVTGFDSMTGFLFGSGASGQVNSSGSTYIDYLLRRAPGFFDAVCYTGNSGTLVVSHNLGVTPELLIIKQRGGSTRAWAALSPLLGGGNYFLTPNNTDASNFGSPVYYSSLTSTTFTLGGQPVTNSSNTYVAYLFATAAGVSKVFSYTGNGSSQTINCGFTAGARFVLIKRTDSTGDWYVWDSARGIVAGNDPHLSLNSTAAEVTTDDSVDTDNTGFVVNQVAATNVNVSSATYIGLAVA